MSQAKVSSYAMSGEVVEPIQKVIPGTGENRKARRADASNDRREKRVITKMIKRMGYPVGL